MSDKLRLFDVAQHPPRLTCEQCHAVPFLSEHRKSYGCSDRKKCPIDYELWRKQLVESFEVSHQDMWAVYESWGEQDKLGLIAWFIANKEKWLK